MSGRNKKLNKELIEEICKYIGAGGTNKDACVMANISEAIFYKWLQIGQKDFEENKKTIYVEFFESIKKAQIKFKLWHVQNISNAAKAGTWTASAWVLERKFYEEYGNKAHIRQIDDDGKETIIEVNIVRDDE